MNPVLVNFLFVLLITIFVGISAVIFMKKLNISRTIIREAILVLTICIFGEITAGIILSDIEQFLTILPGVLVLVPIVSGTRGSLMGIFNSRLTSGLHLGTIKPNIWQAISLKDRIIKENILGIVFLTMLIAILSGVIAHYFSVLFGFQSAGLFKFVFIVLVASSLSDISLILTGIVISFLCFKKGLDPDNLLFPLSTTISDIISILFLVLAVRILV
jgi:mgtE-like transporter